MKLNLISGKDQDGKIRAIGWNFEAETEQEEKDLSVVRNCIFGGLDGMYPEYAGRQDNPNTHLVNKIWYRIPDRVIVMRSGILTCENQEAVDFFNAMY